MALFYKHDIPAWMDGTECMSHDVYRAYHIVVQLIMLNEGPIARNERGIAGRCNMTVKAIGRALDELLIKGKLQLEGDRLTNLRAMEELTAIFQNRENAGKGGKTPRKPKEISENSTKNRKNSGDQPDNPLENNAPVEATLQQEKRREEKKAASAASGAHAHEGPEVEAPAPVAVAPVEPSRSSVSEKARADRQAIEREQTALLDRLVAASGVDVARNPGLLILAPIYALIGEGFDVDRHILPALRNLRARGKTWGSWRFVEGPVRDAGGDLTVAAAALARVRKPENAEAFLARITDSQWRTHVQRWVSTRGAWDLGRHTPPPNEVGCKVPLAILEEFGVTAGSAPDSHNGRRAA